MPTLSVNQSTTDRLEVGKVLNLVLAANSQLLVDMTGPSGAVQRYTPTTSSTLGPFMAELSYKVTCALGSADVYESWRDQVQPVGYSVDLTGGITLQVGATSSKLYGAKGVYLLATFGGEYPFAAMEDTRNLRILSSIDGKNFAPLHDHTAPFWQTTDSVRDPCVVPYGDGWILSYTRRDQIANESQTTLCTVIYSDDLKNWVVRSYPDFSDAVASVIYVWAPTLAVVGSDIYIVASPRTAGGGDVYYKKSTDGGVTWSASVKINELNGELDPNLTSIGSLYFMASAKSIGANAFGINLRTSGSAQGPWTDVYTGGASVINVAFGTAGAIDVEGPAVVWLENKVRIYADLRGKSGLYYIEADYTYSASGVSFGAWSNANLVAGGADRAQIRHGSIVYAKNDALMSVIKATSYAGAEQGRCAKLAASRALTWLQAKGRGLVFDNTIANQVCRGNLAADIGTSDFELHWLVKYPPYKGATAITAGLGFLGTGTTGDAAFGFRFWMTDTGKVCASLVNSGNNGERSLTGLSLSSYVGYGEHFWLTFQRQAGVVSWRVNGQSIATTESTSGVSPPAWADSIRSSWVGIGNYNNSRPFSSRISAFALTNCAMNESDMQQFMAQQMPTDLSRAGVATEAIGAFTIGQRYRVETLGSSTWTTAGSYGAYLGQEFVAKAIGTAGGGGVARKLGALILWNLQDGSGTTAADASGNGITGTLVGTSLPTWNTAN